MAEPRPFFDYFEERPLGAGSNARVNRVHATPDPIGVPDQDWESSPFTWYSAYAFEGRAHVPETEGVWILTDLRIRRHTGDPGKKKWPYESRQYISPVDPSTLKPRVRIHHYFRVLNSEECRRLLNIRGGLSVGLEVTEEWHDPHMGDIGAIPEGSATLGSHCVAVGKYLPASNRLLFENSWGDAWGNKGWGTIAPQVVDRYLVESWGLVGPGAYPPTTATNGLTVLLWKSSVGGQEVHAREIVDAGSSERIAWCFLVRRGRTLDIEELFVWPHHRRKGYGQVLARMARELAVQMRCDLRALVPHADAEPLNRDALKKTLVHAGLHLHPSPMRGMSFLGLEEEHLGGLEEPQIPERPASVHGKLAPDKGARLYSVWFGTNRRLLVEGETRRFTDERGETAHHGVCDVVVPKSHRFGSIRAPWWKRWLRLPDNETLRIAKCMSRSVEDFWAEIAAELAKEPEERQALVFLHGYRCAFKDAALRAAQIGFDMKVPGITAFFSWASAGAALDYATDEASIEASEPAIAQFLSDFTLRSGAERVHLVAHSMGNRGLLRAIQRIVDKVEGVRFGQIILAAPDVDAAVFCDLAQHVVKVADRCTLYASPADRAVSLSKWIHKYPRAGLTPPVTIVNGVDTVEVPRFDLADWPWHNYFAEAASLLHDMFSLIRDNIPPRERPRLQSMQTSKGEHYWSMMQ